MQTRMQYDLYRSLNAMSENQTIASPPAIPKDGEINLLDWLITLGRHKKMIIGVTFVVALIAAGVSLMIPNTYTATARILPPQSSQSSSINAIMLAQLGGLANSAGAALGLKEPNGLYLAMLKSNSVREKIARRFELQKVYDEETMTDTLKALEKRSSISGGKDGVITVDVDDKEPKRAADIANAYSDELNKLMDTLALSEASKRRQFFETQLKQAKNKLTDAEMVLDKIPNTSLHYMDALRNVKYQEVICEILVKQFEMAKLDEAKNAPLIQVLDVATAPEKKSEPQRSLIIILAALGAFFLAVIWAFAKESMQRAQGQPEQAERLQELRQVIRWRG